VSELIVANSHKKQNRLTTVATSAVLIAFAFSNMLPAYVSQQTKAPVQISSRRHFIAPLFLLQQDAASTI